jgi:hypothetical protein
MENHNIWIQPNDLEWKVVVVNNQLEQMIILNNEDIHNFYLVCKDRNTNELVAYIIYSQDVPFEISNTDNELMNQIEYFGFDCP